MSPYQNQSLNEMHALLQQFDTLNAGHAPEHLEMFEGLKKAVTNGYNAAANSEFAMHQLNRATDEEVILRKFSNKESVQQVIDMGLVINSAETRAELKHLMQIMLKSSTLKPIITQKLYPNGIPETLQREIYAEMHPPKKT